MPPGTHPTLAIFASAKGPGDAERASIMSQAGTYFAKRGARLVCLADQNSVAVPLVTSARAAGGDVVIIACADFALPPALADVPVERFATLDECLARVAALTSVYVALPGSLASASSLFLTWVKGGGGAARKPVVFFDRNGAFKVMRGYDADVLSSGIRHHDHYVQFADSIEDVWHKIDWLLEQGAVHTG